ncbi:hypothetical protein T484DRAFT_1882793 [Baffinella frigidus]|jgi:hypothetical protein|nr:hypothetical protein T484DRAFT_1882793 [Cryptophyta sp. CCMP2293]
MFTSFTFDGLPPGSQPRIQDMNHYGGFDPVIDAVSPLCQRLDCIHSRSANVSGDRLLNLVVGEHHLLVKNGEAMRLEHAAVLHGNMLLVHEVNEMNRIVTEETRDDKLERRGRMDAKALDAAALLDSQAEVRRLRKAHNKCVVEIKDLVAICDKFKADNLRMVDTVKTINAAWEVFQAKHFPHLMFDVSDGSETDTDSIVVDSD